MCRLCLTSQVYRLFVPEAKEKCIKSWRLRPSLLDSLALGAVYAEDRSNRRETITD